MIKRIVPVAVLAASLLMPNLSAFAAESSRFNAGDLIKSPTNSTVYYFASNGKRYVFPNDKTYFTWYNDFSTVKTISARAMAAIPLGPNVTYRPGRKMVKITTDPNVYVVDQGGVLRHVATEQLAQSLYSISWKNQIDDVPDSFFNNYRLGTEIQSVRDFQPAAVMTLSPTIADDKQLSKEVTTITIGDMNTNYVPSTVTIKKGTSVTWTNRDIVVHTVTGHGWESEAIAAGASYTHAFPNAGSFDYVDSNFPLMQGTINVLP